MLQRFEAILFFYRPFVIWSFGINIGLVIFNPNVVSALIMKLLLTVFIWYIMNETSTKKKLLFYKNFGISSFKLFAFIYLIDSFLTTLFLLVMKEFI